MLDFNRFSLWRAAGTSSGTEGSIYLTVCTPDSEKHVTQVYKAALL